MSKSKTFSAHFEHDTAEDFYHSFGLEVVTRPRPRL